jgi:flavodoxin
MPPFFTSVTVYPVFFWWILIFLYTHWTYGIRQEGSSFVGQMSFYSFSFIFSFFPSSSVAFTQIFSSVELYGECENFPCFCSSFSWFIHIFLCQRTYYWKNMNFPSGSSRVILLSVPVINNRNGLSKNAHTWTLQS